MLFKTKTIVGAYSLVFAALTASAATAQDTPTFGINDISCRELLIMSGDERDATMIFFNGFISGQSATEVVDPTAMMIASDTVLEQCTGAPDKPLIEVFSSVRGE